MLTLFEAKTIVNTGDLKTMKYTKKQVKTNDKTRKAAFDLGVKAFHDGKKSVPMQDKKLMVMLFGENGNEENYKERLDLIFKSWSDGFSQEHRKFTREFTKKLLQESAA